jgi:hypothetical protein
MRDPENDHQTTHVLPKSLFPADMAGGELGFCESSKKTHENNMTIVE